MDDGGGAATEAGRTVAARALKYVGHAVGLHGGKPRMAALGHAVLTATEAEGGWLDAVLGTHTRTCGTT